MTAAGTGIGAGTETIIEVRDGLTTTRANSTDRQVREHLEDGLVTETRTDHESRMDDDDGPDDDDVPELGHLDDDLEGDEEDQPGDSDTRYRRPRPGIVISASPTAGFTAEVVEEFGFEPRNRLVIEQGRLRRDRLDVLARVLTDPELHPALAAPDISSAFVLLPRWTQKDITSRMPGTALADEFTGKESTRTRDTSSSRALIVQVPWGFVPLAFFSWRRPAEGQGLLNADQYIEIAQSLLGPEDYGTPTTLQECEQAAKLVKERFDHYVSPRTLQPWLAAVKKVMDADRNVIAKHRSWFLSRPDRVETVRRSLSSTMNFTDNQRKRSISLLNRILVGTL